jgi:hypothetical protein
VRRLQHTSRHVSWLCCKTCRDAMRRDQGGVEKLTSLKGSEHTLSILTTISMIISPNFASILTPTKTVLQNLVSCNTQSLEWCWKT